MGMKLTRRRKISGALFVAAILLGVISVWNIGGVLAPIATGFLIARTGSYLSAFTLAAGVLVAGILAYGFIVGELKPVVNEPHY